MKNLLIAAIIFLLGSLVAFVITSRYSFSIAPKSRLPLSPETKISPPSQAENVDFLQIKKLVLPDEGFRLNVSFEDLGPKLVEVGAIDLKKFSDNFDRSGGLTSLQREILTQNTKTPIFINEQNSVFMVNFFWALGLANKNKILDEGPMVKDKAQLGNFASTGGWTLGRKSAVELFSKSEIVKLTDDQQKMVEEIVSNVYRPCCGNPTSFPDCNHGMAALGLAEYLAAKGLSKDEIYRAILYFNSYWFPQTYLDLAAYFAAKGTAWTQIIPQQVLGVNYSSGQGYARIKQELETKAGGRPDVYGSGQGCGT